MRCDVSALMSTRLQRCAILITISIATTSQANAQPVALNAVVGISRESSSGARIVDSSKSNATSLRSGNVTVRLASAGIASGAGMVLGAMLGASMSGPCGCDDPGLVGAVFGGLGGTIAGASIGGAGPRLASVCSFNERLGRSLLGSMLGAVGGIAAATAVHHGVAVLYLLPAFTAGGSVLALGRCERSTS